MPYQWIHETDAEGQRWELKRNCALTPRQCATCFAAVGGVSVGIAGLFALHGAWPVVPFACIELAALTAAFFAYGRHAGDYERIEWQPRRGRVRVERVDGARRSVHELPASWVRVEFGAPGTAGDDGLIRLVSGREVQRVGRFVPHDRRAGLARELRCSLQQRTGAEG